MADASEISHEGILDSVSFDNLNADQEQEKAQKVGFVLSS